jgi:hypothetical protein
MPHNLATKKKIGQFTTLGLEQLQPVRVMAIMELEIKCIRGLAVIFYNKLMDLNKTSMSCTKSDQAFL